MKLRTKKRLSLIFGLYSAAIVCPTIFYSVAKAQEQSDCFIVDPVRQVCISDSQGQELIPITNPQYFFQRGREFDVQGQHQEAIVDYTQALQITPDYVEAYFYRGSALALEGQPQKGIEDLQKAAAILESRG